MGLSSSQGRLLMLTSRLSDIELNEILISQKQGQLALQSENAAKEYNEAINNYKLVIKTPDFTGAEQNGYTVEDVSPTTLQAAGYLVHDAQGNIYLFNKTGDGYINPQNAAGEEMAEVYQDEETGEWKVKIIADGTNAQERRVIDGSEAIKDSTTLQNMIINGQLFLYNTNTGQGGISTANLPSETQIEYILDTSDDAQAESKYEYDLARISRQDNMLDIELQQMETQHEAILKEIESVKKVISNNVDRTFKIFSDG